MMIKVTTIVIGIALATAILWLLFGSTGSAEAPPAPSAMFQTKDVPEPQLRAFLAERQAVDNPARESLLDEVGSNFDIPVNQRPATLLEYRERHTVIIDAWADTGGYGIKQQDELEALAAAGDPLALHHLALRNGSMDPMLALAQFDQAALGGVVNALPSSARVLRNVVDGDPDLEPEVRAAIIREIYARYIAAVMFGYGEYRDRLPELRQTYGEVAPTRAVCMSGVALVAAINGERTAQHQTPLPVMFSGRETIDMFSGLGMCG